MKTNASKAYKVPYEYAIKAETKAQNIRKSTGKQVAWTDIIQAALKAYFK